MSAERSRIGGVDGGRGRVGCVDIWMVMEFRVARLEGSWDAR